MTATLVRFDQNRHTRKPRISALFQHSGQDEQERLLLTKPDLSPELSAVGIDPESGASPHVRRHRSSARVPRSVAQCAVPLVPKPEAKSVQVPRTPLVPGCPNPSPQLSKRPSFSIGAECSIAHACR